MRRMTAMLSVMMIVLTAVGAAAQAKPSFAGEWKIMVPEGHGQGVPGVDLVITQTVASMTVEDMRSSGPAPVKLAFPLDGSAGKTSKAAWAGNSLVVTTTTAAGDEKRTFSMDGGYLVVETSSPRKGAAPAVTRAAYQKYVHGFGG